MLARVVPLVLLGLSGFGAAARAQSEPVQLTVQANATRVQVGDTFEVDVMVALNAAGEPEELVLPDLSDFEIVRQERAPTSQRTVVVNGRVSSSRTFGFIFHLRATQAGQKTIGPGRVRLGGHVSASRPVIVDVLEREGAGAGGLSSALDPAARFKGKDTPPYFVDARFDRDQAYVGQQVLYTVDVYTTEYVDLDLRSLAPPKPPGFWTEVIDTPTRIRPTQRTVGGKSYLVYQVMRVALFPLEVGERVLEPLSVTLLTTQGSWRRRNEVRLTSDPVALLVQPLPKTGRPADFPQANVGHWQLRAEVSDRELPLGQPFTLKVTAGGEGNLQALELPDVTAGLEGARVFPPTTSETKGVQQGRLHGEKTLELLVQPKRAGAFEVPAFTLRYFDPDDGTYKEARSSPISLRVKGGRLAGSAEGERAGPSRISKNARPVLRKLQITSATSTPLYSRPAYLIATSGVALLGVFAFLFGMSRAGQRETLDARAARQRRARRRELEAARERRDLAAAERALYDALAERFGDAVRGLSSAELERAVEGRLAPDATRALLRWLDAAQAARYAPRAGADKKALFDDVTALLDAVEASS